MDNSTSDKPKTKRVPFAQCPECFGRYKPCGMCESTGHLFKTVPIEQSQPDPILKLDTSPPK